MLFRLAVLVGGVVILSYAVSRLGFVADWKLLIIVGISYAVGRIHGSLK